MSSKHNATDDSPPHSNNDSNSCRKKRLCRFEPNASPILVQTSSLTSNTAKSEMTLAKLEELLEDCLDDRQQPLNYIQRDDVSFLNCQRPLVTPLESVLGMEEESNRDPGQRKLVIVPYHPVSHSNSNPSHKHSYHCCSDHNIIPKLSWSRVDLPEPTNHSPSNDTTPIIRVEWCDLRSFPRLDFPSTASCAHFLRCLLDARHDSSPWVPQHVPQLSGDDKDVVILVVSRTAGMERLIDFRVSDVCPSWFLHAVGYLKHVNATTMPWLERDNGTCGEDEQQEEEEEEEAVMMIYRRLPAREGLTLLHPRSQEPAPNKNCLWHTKVVIPKDELPQVKIQLVGPPIQNVSEEYPNLLEPLLQPKNLQIMQEEAIRIAHWTAWPEQQHYKAISDTGEPVWNVFPLVHCFPANELKQRQWVPLTCAAVPRTVELLQTHLGGTLRTALFSRLDPHSVLEAHTGWADLANHVLRVHIPLKVPEGDLCGIWVDGCVQLHPSTTRESGVQAVCFDDSKTHRAFNYSSESRIVLILDLARPATLPEGSATGGHSDELDEFIKKMGVAR